MEEKTNETKEKSFVMFLYIEQCNVVVFSTYTLAMEKYMELSEDLFDIRMKFREIPNVFDSFDSFNKVKTQKTEKTEKTEKVEIYTKKVILVTTNLHKGRSIVFENLEDAKKYCDNTKNSRVYICTVNESSELVHINESVNE